MSDYTPTTEDARRVARILSTCREFDPEMCDGCDKRVQEAERLLNSSWLVEVIRKAKNDAWFEGFSAGWDECDDPSGFVNDKWDAKTPNPYGKENND